MPPAKTPPPQTGLPMTIDPATAILHETGRQQHEERMRVADAARLAEALRSADAEVDSWSTSKPVAVEGPAAPPQVGSEAAPASEQPAQAATPPQPPQPEQPTTGVKREPLPFYPTNTDEMWRYAQMLARSKLLPKAFYPKGDWDKEHARVADVHVVLMKGHDLGLKPMQSIGTINVIDGKAEVGALLMVALILKSGRCDSWQLVHSDERRAVYRTRRRGDSDWIPFEYTIEEADLMGLLDKGKDEKARENNQWRRQPRTMLRRRCQSMLAREVYSDVVLGLYDTDELTEMREREIALGVDPDRVLPMNGLPHASIALPEGAAPGAIEQLAMRVAADPLKARLEARRAVAAGGLMRRCSLCDQPLDPRDSDPCIACRPGLSPAG